MNKRTNLGYDETVDWPYNQCQTTLLGLYEVVNSNSI